MKKIINSWTFRIIYPIIAFTIIFYFDNYELAIVLIFLPLPLSAIIKYREFEKTYGKENHVMLSKSNFNYWNFILAGAVSLYSILNLNLYLGILLLLTLIYLFLEYTVSKRRILFIDENGIDELGKDKHRDLKEITSLEIYPSNVEIQFNKHEILQINQNELISPKWDNFMK